MRKSGFSLLEVLVTVGIIGIAVASLSVLSQPSQRGIAANDIKAMVQQARFESIKRNVAVAVIWDSNDNALYMKANNANAALCTGNSLTLIQTKLLSDYRNVSLETSNLGNVDNSSGIIWLPNSVIQTCSGSVVNGSFKVTDTAKNESVSVQISAGGKTELQ